MRIKAPFLIMDEYKTYCECKNCSNLKYCLESSKNSQDNENDTNTPQTFTSNSYFSEIFSSNTSRQDSFLKRFISYFTWIKKGFK